MINTTILTPAKPDQSAIQNEEDGWVRMFDGKSLDGWFALSNPHVWSVRDELIIGRHTASVGDDFLESLLFYTREQVRDFEWKAECGFRCNWSTDSGMKWSAGPVELVQGSGGTGPDFGYDRNGGPHGTEWWTGSPESDSEGGLAQVVEQGV